MCTLAYLNGKAKQYYHNRVIHHILEKPSL